MDFKLIDKSSTQNRWRNTRKVLEILHCLTIECDSHFSWVRDQWHWKNYVLSLHAYVKHPNQRSDMSCMSIWMWDDPGRWVGFDVKLCNSELDCFSTLMGTSPSSPALFWLALFTHRPVKPAKNLLLFPHAKWTVTTPVWTVIYGQIWTAGFGHSFNKPSVNTLSLNVKKVPLNQLIDT
jgi:hypothetical protein